MRTVTGFLTLCIIGLAGCQTADQGGPVIGASNVPGWQGGPAVGLMAPSAKFTGMDNKPHSLRADTGWITVVGFFASKGKECCYLSPELTEAASRYWNKPVRVVQVALPTEKCPHGAGCVEACHINALHLMALCDPARAAYNAFGRPKSDTVLLIGGDGKVVAITTLKGIDKILPQIDRLAAEAERKSLPQYVQTYIE